MKELLEHRKENSKTYDLGGNKKRWSGATGPIHYKETYNESEPWLDIDRGSRIDEGEYWFYDKLPIKVRLKKDNTFYEVEDRKTGQKIEVELLSSKEGLLLEPIVHKCGVQMWQEAESDRTVQWRVRTIGEGNLKFVDEPKVLRFNETNPQGEKIAVTYRTTGISKNEKLWEVALKKGDKVDPEVNLEVSSGADDGHRYIVGSSGISTADTYMNIQYLSGKEYFYHLWSRFTGVAIPRGAIITFADIEYVCEYDTAAEGPSSRVFLNAADNAAAPTTGDAYDAMVLTDSFSNWSLGSMVEGGVYQSPDISPAVKEVIDRGGWSSGNALCVLHKAIGSIQGSKYFSTYENETYDPPKLNIEYVEPVPDNAERDAKVTGKQATNAERDAKLTGKALATAERDAKVTGVATTNAERDAKVTGKSTANAMRSAKISGKNTATDSRSAKINGKAEDYRSAKITGKTTANATRNAKVIGKSTANAERSAKITGILGANDSRNAKLTGVATTSNSRSAKITGKLTDNDSRSAKLTGKATATNERNAKITGKSTANDSRSAKVTGTLGANASRSAKLTGKSTVSDSRPATTKGKISTTNTRSAKVGGKAQASALRSAKVTGKQTANDARGAKTTGKQGANDSRNARLTGNNSANAERNAKLTGGTATLTANSYRRAVIVGTGDIFVDDPKDWYEADPRDWNTTDVPDWKWHW